MKQFALFLMLLTITFGCKQYDPEAILKPIVGSWIVSEREQTENGKKTWVTVADSLRGGYTFREDGAVMMGEFTSCCHPKFFSINGQKVKAPANEKLNMHPMCAYVNCVYSETWYIEVQGDELILSFEGGSRTKYVRVRKGF